MARGSAWLKGTPVRDQKEVERGIWGSYGGSDAKLIYWFNS